MNRLGLILGIFSIVLGHSSACSLASKVARRAFRPIIPSLSDRYQKPIWLRTDSILLGPEGRTFEKEKYVPKEELEPKEKSLISMLSMQANRGNSNSAPQIVYVRKDNRLLSTLLENTNSYFTKSPIKNRQDGIVPAAPGLYRGLPRIESVPRIESIPRAFPSGDNRKIEPFYKPQELTVAPLMQKQHDTSTFARGFGNKLLGIANTQPDLSSNAKSAERFQPVHASRELPAIPLMRKQHDTSTFARGFGNKLLGIANTQPDLPSNAKSAETVEPIYRPRELPAIQSMQKVSSHSSRLSGNGYIKFTRLFMEKINEALGLDSGPKVLKGKKALENVVQQGNEMAVQIDENSLIKFNTENLQKLLSALREQQKTEQESIYSMPITIFQMVEPGVVNRLDTTLAIRFDPLAVNTKLSVAIGSFDPSLTGSNENTNPELQVIPSNELIQQPNNDKNLHSDSSPKDAVPAIISLRDTEEPEVLADITIEPTKQLGSTKKSEALNSDSNLMHQPPTEDTSHVYKSEPLRLEVAPKEQTDINHLKKPAIPKKTVSTNDLIDDVDGKKQADKEKSQLNPIDKDKEVGKKQVKEKTPGDEVDVSKSNNDLSPQSNDRSHRSKDIQEFPTKDFTSFPAVSIPQQSQRSEPVAEQPRRTEKNNGSSPVTLPHVPHNNTTYGKRNDIPTAPPIMPLKDPVAVVINPAQTTGKGLCREELRKKGPATQQLYPFTMPKASQKLGNKTHVVPMEEPTKVHSINFSKPCCNAGQPEQQPMASTSTTGWTVAAKIGFYLIDIAVVVGMTIRNRWAHLLRRILSLFGL